MTNRTILLTLSIVVSLAMSTVAQAAEDNGDGTCVQSDGQVGVWNGTTADDDGCVTPAEYEAMFSAANLLVVGVIEGYTVHEDGTTTLYYSYGGNTTVATNPLDRIVAVNPALEPDAPTVREWFENPYGPR